MTLPQQKQLSVYKQTHLSTQQLGFPCEETSQCVGSRRALNGLQKMLHNKLFYYCFILSLGLCDQKVTRRADGLQWLISSFQPGKPKSDENCASFESWFGNKNLVKHNNNINTNWRRRPRQQTDVWMRPFIPSFSTHKLFSALVSLILWLCLPVFLSLYPTKQQWWKPNRVNLSMWGSVMVWLLPHIQSRRVTRPRLRALPSTPYIFTVWSIAAGLCFIVYQWTQCVQSAVNESSWSIDVSLRAVCLSDIVKFRNLLPLIRLLPKWPDPSHFTAGPQLCALYAPCSLTGCVALNHQSYCWWCRMFNLELKWF